MAFYRLTFLPDLPDQSQVLELDGVKYTLRAYYNTRTAQWYLDVFEEDGTTPLLIGEALGPQSRIGRGSLDFTPLVHVSTAPEEAQLVDIANNKILIGFLEA